MKNEGCGSARARSVTTRAVVPVRVSECSQRCKVSSVIHHPVVLGRPQRLEEGAESIKMHVAHGVFVCLTVWTRRV